jgi:hypothetical protein
VHLSGRSEGAHLPHTGADAAADTVPTATQARTSQRQVMSAMSSLLRCCVSVHRDGSNTEEEHWHAQGEEEEVRRWQ